MKMVISSHFAPALLSALILATNYLTSANDSPMLQDFCPAIPGYRYGHGHKKIVAVNGKFCKDPETVNSEDFKCSGKEEVFPSWGFKTTTYDIHSCPAVNTMGISGAMDWYNQGGYVPTHYHQRASQLTIVKKGYIVMGFVSGKRSYFNLLGPRHSMVVPQGLMHFSMNVGKGPAETFTALSSQNPGTVFPYNYPVKSATHTPMDLDKLAQQIPLDAETIDMIKNKLAELEN